MNEIILDTNVLFAGLYSANGASYKILRLLAAGKLHTVISTPLLFEYEDIFKVWLRFKISATRLKWDK